MQLCRSKPLKALHALDTDISIIRGCDDRCRFLATLHGLPRADRSLPDFKHHLSELRAHRTVASCILRQCAWTASLVLHASPFPPSLRLQVNRGTCRFGRYKIPRRPHPPPRASRVSHHPPQVSGLTLAHPCSPTLTRPHPLPSARPIDSAYAGPFLAPGQCGRNGLPRRRRFWIATHRMVDC